jgi:hypothetical protein
MGLTAVKHVRLEDAGLTGFFTKSRKRWTAMAEHAYAYTSRFVEDADEEVRPDDLLAPLVAALEVDTKLREYLAEERLSQKYWFTYFAELIVDELWDELTEEEEDDGEE